MAELVYSNGLTKKKVTKEDPHYETHDYYYVANLFFKTYEDRNVFEAWCKKCLKGTYFFYDTILSNHYYYDSITVRSRGKRIKCETSSKAIFYDKADLVTLKLLHPGLQFTL